MNKNDNKQFIAEIIGEYASHCGYRDLPERTLYLSKIYILDTIGCIIGASQEPQSKILAETLKNEGGNKHSTAISQGFKTSSLNAALLNGTMGHIYDYDDVHCLGGTHTSVAVLPAVLALGEKLHVSGKELLKSYIVGMEVAIRIGEAFLGKSFFQGFQATGVSGVFGAAAGCATMMKQSSKQITYALGLAGSFSSGIMEGVAEGSWQKPLQPGHAAMSGLLCASLSSMNFIGARTIFEGNDGIIRAFSYKNEYDFTPITRELGIKWEIENTSIKKNASCRFGAPSVDCALDLYGKGVRSDNLEAIVARVASIAIDKLTKPTERKMKPVTPIDAQFSLPYMIAVSICKNRAGKKEFWGSTLEDPEILKLMKKITWEVNEEADRQYPKKYIAELEAKLTDGTIVKAYADHPKGDPENPMTMSEVKDKFCDLTDNILSIRKQKQIIHTIMDLANQEDISTLLRHMR